MLVIPLGSWISLSLEHPLNNELEISFTPLGIRMGVVNSEHPSNADIPK